IAFSRKNATGRPARKKTSATTLELSTPGSESRHLAAAARLPTAIIAPTMSFRERYPCPEFALMEAFMKAGAHVSTAGGPATGFERAEAIGAEAMQIFLTPPQQWRSSKVEASDAEKFRARHAASSVGEV